MYTIIKAFSDVIYEVISAISPRPILWFDIDKNSYRLYLCASHKLKNVNYQTVCDCMVYCSEIFGKDIKKAVFANKDITEEGIKSLMRLAKRVNDDDIKIDKVFVAKELKNVVANFNDSAIEAVGEAIIRGVSYDEYIKRSGYCKKNFAKDPDVMWIVTHQVLNDVKTDFIKKGVNKRASYNEVVNSYLTMTRGIDVSGLDLFHKIYHKTDIDMSLMANTFIKALNDGIDLTPFLKEKRLLSMYNDPVSVSIDNPNVQWDLDLNPMVISDNAYTAALMDYVLNRIYDTRMSGVDNDTIINYLRNREKLSTIDFIKNCNEMELLQQGIIV